MRRAALLLALALAGAPGAATAHETRHEVRRGAAVAVRAWLADGEPLAYAAFEVYSPAEPAIPHLKGRTDRQGWLAFVPDAPGRWRVRVVEETGHGLDVEVDAAPPADAAPAAAPAGGPLRTLAGLLAIGLVFGGLYLLQRRRARR